MYETFFRLTGIPFQLTPDSRFFFGSAGHSRAISHLVYGLSQEEGFIVITGEVGAGKTTLVEHLWTRLDRASYAVGRVVTTLVSGDDLLRLAVTSFGIADDGTDKATLLRRFEAMVRAQRQAGRRCLLVIDEAQNLSVATLEELRMLSNITVDGRASVQTILLGQPQFRPLLARPELEQLRQRVLASYHLGPLSEAETRQYIEHRLRLVDLRGALQKAEIELEPMVNADQPNDEQILAQVKNVAEARAQLEVANARLLLDIRHQLTPEQWQTMRQLIAERRAQMEDQRMNGMGNGMGNGMNRMGPGRGPGAGSGTGPATGVAPADGSPDGANLPPMPKNGNPPQ